MNNIMYINGGKELLDLVQPLWEKLNNYHKANSNYFSNKYDNLTFEIRRNKFINETILHLRIDLVKDIDKNINIGYCISTINKELTGEIDSLFIEKEYRNYGIGDELMNRALMWLEHNEVKTKIIAVAEGNENVIEFYQRYGFYKRRIVLEQIS